LHTKSLADCAHCRHALATVRGRQRQHPRDASKISGLRPIVGPPPGMAWPLQLLADMTQDGASTRAPTGDP
jgi:hypothetical protein